MEVKDIFSLLVKEIHSTVFATVDKNGFPHTCVIDLMLCDDSSIYFLTSRGKEFYTRLLNQEYVSLSGMKGNDTLSTVVVSVCGKIRELGGGLVGKVFEQNTYMERIYPNEISRKVLTVFQIYEGEGELFDLRQQPPFRESFSFGGADITQAGYHITDACRQCGKCIQACPSGCIEEGTPFFIHEENCIHCGTCYEICPFSAVKKKKEEIDRR